MAMPEEADMDGDLAAERTFTRRELLGAAAAGALVACAGPMGAGGPHQATGRAAGPATASGPAPSGPRPMKLLILGGTVFLGPELVELARARGHEVTLFNRGKTRPGLFPDVEKLHGDRDGQLDALKGRRWDAVIDTSGYVPRLVGLSAALLAPAVERYLFISSISAYAEGVRAPVLEEAATAPLADPASEDVQKDYGALKAACERAAEAALPGRALSIRPGLIVGPGDPTDRFTYWPVRLARGGEVLAPGDGADPVQVIDVRDLAALAVRCAEDRRSGLMNAVGPVGRLTMRGLVAGCAAGVGADPSATWVEAGFLDAQHVAPWSDLPAWMGKDEALAQCANARAVAAGLACRPVADTARDTLDWWRGLPEERRRSPKAGLAPAREAEVLDAWRARRAG
jgi:2'-hydroxyisoflavone reductase